MCVCAVRAIVCRTTATKVTTAADLFSAHFLFALCPLCEVRYARIGEIHCDHWRGRDARGSGHVERFHAKMVGPTYQAIFGSSENIPRSIFPSSRASLSASCLACFSRSSRFSVAEIFTGWGFERCCHGPVARLILRVVQQCANGPQGRGYSNSPKPTRQTCKGASSLPSLPAHAIGAGFRRRGSERRNDHWAGARSQGTNVETTVCAHCRQNTFPLVRTILRNG